ncbi:MAG: hypothetical protein KA170_02415 [Candidatus Promineofilum sp.]|nr:hypothetical protein [Promineifilum sp.]
MDIAAILVSQYLASLEMLRRAIVACPDSLWNAPEDKNKFWHTAYHALYFIHVYASESERTVTPWAKHREGYDEYTPADREPYDKATVLEFLDFCRIWVAEKVPQLKLDDMEGLPDPEMRLLELQIYSIRHIMQHVGELLERLGARTDGEEIDWVGWVHN